MNERHVGLVSYANVTYDGQLRGPVPSGLMLEGAPHLAGRLLQQGFMPRIFDYSSVDSVRRISLDGQERFEEHVAEELTDYVQRNDVKALGFTLYNNGLKGILRIASLVKKRFPSLLMIAGGPVVNYGEEVLYQMENGEVFDALCLSEGDLALPAFAEYAYGRKPLREVPNLIFRDNSRTPVRLVNINTLPFPVYDKEIYPGIDDKIHIPVVKGSTGCRYGQCSFCVQPKIDGKFRIRDFENLLAEVEHLRNKYGFRHIRLTDPNPFSREIVYLARHAPEGMKISAFTYTDSIDDFEEAKKILSGIFLGVESFKPEVLLQLNKTRDPEKYIAKARRMIENAKKAGIPSVVAVIVPVANDSVERIDYEYRTVLELNPDSVVSMAQCPVPGTRDYYDVLQRGDETGLRFGPDFRKDMISLELDLLRPPATWPALPWSIRVDGEFTDKPFMINAKHFLGRLMKEHGFSPFADENILMAQAYHDGLPEDQKERRKVIVEFNSRMRDSIAQQDVKGLEEIVNNINSNQNPPGKNEEIK
ncbi:radical SAM protein [Candidatus Woesearchaeota archaeon]|nr:radical SAM protein [Candidatus Woesearchaeota archaeon]